MTPTSPRSAARSPTSRRPGRTLRALLGALLLGLVGLGCDGVISEPASSEPGAGGRSGEGGEPPPVGVLPDPSCSERGPGNGPSMVRRLTREEYVSTVSAALGVELDPRETGLAPEVRSRGFTNDYGNLLPSQQVVLGYRRFGKELAAELVADGRIWLGEPACEASDVACVEGWIGTIGQRLFRRPLAADEIAAYRRLFITMHGELGDAERAAAGTLRGLLMAPQTIYRLEDESSPELGAVELASRLSFLVAGAGPDAELLEAALSGRLDDEGEVGRQIERLLGTPNAARALDELAYGWLHLDELEGLSPTGGDAELDAELVRSAQALVRAVWLEDEGELRDVVTARFTIPVSERVARHAGLDGATPGERFSTEDDPRRAGLLTEPAVLAGTGRDSDPLIHRALFVYKDLLCETIPAPPDGATTSQPGDPTASERVRSELRAESGTCGGCHSAVDPFAYAFEPYGFPGQWRERDEWGNAPRSDGAFMDAEGVTHEFETPREFADALHADARINPCILRRIVQGAWGRTLTAGDACDLAQIHARFEELGSTYEAALVAIATHPSFRAKRPR